MLYVCKYNTQYQLLFAVVVALNCCLLVTRYVYAYHTLLLKICWSQDSDLPIGGKTPLSPHLLSARKLMGLSSA